MLGSPRWRTVTQPNTRHTQSGKTSGTQFRDRNRDCSLNRSIAVLILKSRMCWHTSVTMYVRQQMVARRCSWKKCNQIGTKKENNKAIRANRSKSLNGRLLIFVQKNQKPADIGLTILKTARHNSAHKEHTPMCRMQCSVTTNRIRVFQTLP